ncbi:MAG TPA: glycosyltransferase family 1 protein [Candidatus Binatia bacterium]|nr:glycosyltransferase family 1 protein [Candidatus Binatia bacterium]
MRSNLRIIVTGLIAQYPLGGVTWDYFQYVLGLKQLGHDVYYLEDTGQWPYNPQEGGLGKECDFNVQYLARIMSRYGLSEQWAYRFPWQSQWFGLPDWKRQEVIRSADLLINVSGTLERPEEYRAVSRLAYIDSDPVFTQVKLARGQLDFRKWIDIHDVQFSFGECLPAEAPETGHKWRPTRQPIVMSEWRPEKPFREVFTTVMNWTSYKPVVYGNRSYGQKDLEFMRFQELPSLIVPTALEIAVNAGKTRRTPRQLLAHKGWRVVDPAEVCPDLDSYRNYIESSKAEWSVAKNGYVVGRCGWFSCRSACYLAAGRPVAVQDTGFGDVLPVGEGLLSFRTVEEAVASIKDIEGSYARHAKAARELAAEYFDATKVLARLIDDAVNVGN